MFSLYSDGQSMRLDMSRWEKAEQNKEAAPTGPITETVMAREKNNMLTPHRVEKKSALVEQNWLTLTFFHWAAVFCSPYH